jgi:N-hydroxyarylamine O-acetyltransferase
MSSLLLENYLSRLGVAHQPSVSETSLFDLHRNHAFSFPFENISPFLHRPVSLDIESIHQKLLGQGRGGYCFEQNGLFSWALSAMGFDFEVLLARVQVHNPQPGPLTHQLGIVRIGNHDYLCDVGFGGPCIRTPMPLEVGRVEIQDFESFRIVESSDFGYGLQALLEGEIWQPLYWFKRQRVLPVDILMGNHFCSTWEKSIFRGNLFSSLPFKGGKHTLMNRNLKERRAGELIAARKLASGIELVKELRERFKIVLDEEVASSLQARFEYLPE